MTNPSLAEGALHVARQKIISNRSLLFHASRIGMPAFIQAKVFAYKGWHPPNFHIHVPPKIPKDTEIEVQELEPGEIAQDPKEQEALRTANLELLSDGETMEDIEEDMHLEEDTIQEQLLPCSFDSVELEEALVEPDTNGLPPLDAVLQKEMQHSGDADEPLGYHKGTEADIGCSGVEAKLDGESREPVPAADKMETANKKSKPKKKKSVSEEGSQALGDKVS